MATFTTGGDGSWTLQTSIVYDTEAWESPSLVRGEMSWLEAEVTGPGIGVFAWRYNAETGDNQNPISFYVDGKLLCFISYTDLLWKERTFEVGEGTHTLRWEYERTGIDDGATCNVEILQDPVESTNTPKNHTLTTGGDHLWSLQENQFFVGPNAWGCPALSAGESAYMDLYFSGSGVLRLAIYHDGNFTSDLSDLSLYVNGTQIWTLIDNYYNMFWHEHYFTFCGEFHLRFLLSLGSSGSADANSVVFDLLSLEEEGGISEIYRESLSSKIHMLAHSEQITCRPEHMIFRLQSTNTYSSSEAWVNGEEIPRDEHTRLHFIFDSPTEIAFAAQFDCGDPENTGAYLYTNESGDAYNYNPHDDSVHADLSSTEWQAFSDFFGASPGKFTFSFGRSWDSSIYQQYWMYLDITDISFPSYSASPEDAVLPEPAFMPGESWTPQQTETYTDNGTAWLCPSNSNYAPLHLYITGPAYIKFAWKGGHSDSDFGQDWNHCLEFKVDTTTCFYKYAYSDWSEELVKIGSGDHAVTINVDNNVSDSYVEILRGFFHVPPSTLYEGIVVDFWSLLSCGRYHIAGINTDGTCSCAGRSDSVETEVLSWTAVEKVFLSGSRMGGYDSPLCILTDQTSDGYITDRTDTILTHPSWGCLVQIAGGVDTAWGLKSDGTVIYYTDQEDNTGATFGTVYWTKVIKLVTNGTATSIFGIRTNGELLGIGGYADGMPTTSDIIDVASYYPHSLALHSDGTVTAWGSDNSYGELDVSTWTDVIQVAAGFWSSCGLRSDGTVLYAGRDYYGEGTAATGWTGVELIAAHGYLVAGLKSDGTVVAGGDDTYGAVTGASAWTGMRTLSDVSEFPICLTEEDVGIYQTKVTWDWVY